MGPWNVRKILEMLSMEMCENLVHYTVVLRLSDFSHLNIFSTLEAIIFIRINHSHSTNYLLPGAELIYPPKQKSLIFFFNLTTHQLSTQTHTHITTYTHRHKSTIKHYDRWMVFSQAEWERSNRPQFKMPQVPDSHLLLLQQSNHNPRAFKR